LIYLDTSVALAHLFKEERAPAAGFWGETLVSSRLLEYELWTRLNARGFGATHGEAARMLLGRVSFLELAPPVLARMLDPFPSPVRTLDAIHLASMEFLRERRQAIVLASYDERLNAAARALGIPLAA
jgi:predicted nucleic acid-binding protein